MSSTVTLNASTTSAERSNASVTVTQGGNPVNPDDVSWASSDHAVATVDIGGKVTAVADSVASTRTCTITATATFNGAQYTGSGTVTVVTAEAGEVVVTLNFGAPYTP